MSHKYVSNKAVLKDKGFLSKLGSTLMGRSNPDPFVDVKVQSSITWRKTSDVKARIKTATGTIPVYDDLGEEEMAVLQAEALAAAGGSAPSFSGPAAVAVQTAALAAGFGQEETTQEATTVATYLVKEDYSPEDSEGLAAVSGQKLILVDKSSPNKRPRLEGDEAGTQLLDNSAARHKMAIRPKRNHPDPRSRAHDTGEERWLMRDQESGKEGLVPSRILELHSEFTTSMIASLKRSVQQIAMEETAEVKKNLMKEIREYKSRKSSSKLLGPSPEDEARAKRAATIRELIETEEEFVRDLEFVMENYYSLMDKNTTPRNVRDHKELIFNNFKFIADFHKNVLIEGVKYNVEVPKMIGKTFLRLERDFDKHAEYCSNEPLAQEFIENNIPVKEFFEEYSQKLGDDKRLQEHLKLPIQRLNDYQLLIRELVKYSTRLGDDPSDLQRAFELMQTIPQRATDAKFISSIEGFKGNLFKLGRLLRHDWFSVKEAGQKARDRYLFLFKARILITKVKRISEDRSIFILKDIIRLPETSLGSLDNPKAIEFFHIESLTHPNYPIFIEARTPEIREAWLAGIGEYVVDTASVEDLLFDDELRVVSQDVDEDDAGVVSPVPEVQEFEDLPEDGEAAEALPEQEDFWAREPSPPAKRQKPEAVPEEIAEVDFWAQKEPTPPRRKPVPELTPAEEAAPEQVEESTPVAEQEKASAEQASFIPQEPSPSAQQAQEAAKLRKKKEEERLQKEKEEEERKQQEEKERLEKEKKEREEKERLQREKEEEERKAKEAKERERKEREERERKEREEKEREEKERLEKEKKEREEKEKKEREEKERLEKERKEREEKERKEREEKERLEKEKKEREEKERKEREEKERKEREERERKEREEKERKEREEKERKEREEKERKEREEKERKEREEKERKEKEEKERLEREKKEKEEREKREEEERERLRKEKEEREREERERKEREERERKEKEERERKEREEKERKEREEKERKEREERERILKEREEQERKEREERERKEREEKERKEREERERIEREEKERKEREERERKEKEEKERKEREERERIEREERERKEREEKERREREEKERKEREERERKEKEEKERKEREERERIEREERERREREEKERKEREEREKKEREERERKEREERERKEQEEKERKEREERERIEREEKEKREKQERERKEKEERERKEREERERKEKEERERKEREERERKEKEERERIEREKKEREEQERKEREERERKAREEKERKEREERERKEREERERKEKEERERKEREELERKAREERERKEKEERERKEREERERKEREEKEKKEREERERREREEKERKEREERERKEKEEKERKEREEREKKEREERELKEKREKEEKLRKEKEEQERKQKEEAERKERERLQREREEKERKEREEKEKEEKAKREREEKERKEKEERELKEREEKARKEREEAKRAADEKALPAQPVKRAKAMDRLLEEQSRSSDSSVEDAFEKMAQEAAEEEEVEEFWEGRDVTSPEGVKEAEPKEEGKKEVTKEDKKDVVTPQSTPKDKPEPSKPAEAKSEAPKPAEVKPEPPKPTEAKVETPKPAEVKPEPPKPAEVKPEPPKPAAVPKQEPPKPEVQTRAPLAKLATPAPHKMQEPTTPFTPGGTPKPVFTKTLKGDVVEPGDGVTFVCEVAHPAPYFITWLKDSKPLDDKLADRVQQTDAGAKHALKVLNCRVEDSGIYTAKATDENGVWSTCSAQLLVQELTEEERARRIAEKSPFFMVRMKPTQVIENTNLSYTIHVKGDPMPNVTFFKDDKELKEDARVTIHRDAAIGHYELLITHVQREDEGTYKCVATNKFGKAECEASMTVTDEEMLYESLSGKGSLLAKGEKAEFKWFRDGVEFDPHERFNVMFKDDEDTLALVFQNVTPEDAGLYTCVASTSCGKISCSAELTVEGSINRLQRDPEPPNFKEELADTQVNVGGSAMLECKIGGYPKPELAWTRNGLDVKAGGRVKFLWEDEESVALIIKNCEEKDAGLYRVIAKNELGEVSCSAKLGIKAGPKIVSMKKEVACVVGQKLDYRVEVEGEPTPEIRWLKDGKQLMESDHIKFTKESDTVFAFKIDSMQMDDCCTYTVVASNPMGQVSEFFTIATDAAPQITRGLDPEIEKRYTYDIALEVRGTGSPKPMARWYKNGKEIMADDRFKMVVDESFYILKIRRLERKDKGTYCCELSNSSGTAKTEGVLSVRAPPDFVTPLKDACAKEGGKDVKMFVEWEANPAPTVKWFFNDKPIRDDTPGYTLRGQDTSMVLTIHEATEDVVGTYTVKATNEYGESVCKARFRLHEAPVVTEGLKDAEFLEDSSAKFTFKATGVPTPEIKWTKDGKKWSPDMNRVKIKQEGDDTFTLYFDEAKTEDSGHYVATISNVEGTASTEATIVVNTPPHIKGSNFRDGKTFIAMHKFVLEVEATAVPEAEATWYFNDKKLSAEEDNVKFAFDGNKYTMERIGSDPEHSGQYKCVLKNKIKEVEEIGQVTVIEKEARVRRPLEDIYVKENTDATLKCQIVGDPIPSVEWLRNGKPLPPSERYEVSEERMKGWHTLVLKEVTEQDKSTFTVKGKNKHGECETTARLGVLVRPQPGELHDATVDYGKDLLLNVAIHAFPPPKMVWTLDGRELQEGDHYEYTRDEEKEVYGLLVHSAVLEDAGKITFTASNAAGSESGSCTVKVHTEKPAIVADLEDLSFCLEDDAVFTLRASGLPLPDVEWKLHDKVVKADERHVFTNPEPGVYCMTIKDVCMNDYGPVAVVAKSLVGECASAAKFSQKKIPCEVVEGLENVTKGAEGDDVSLTVKIRASPRPNFVWTKDSDNCEASEKIIIEMKKTSYCEATISLTLVEASSIDSGQYRLRFQNELNEESSETALIVRPERRKPKITKPPKELQVLERKRGIFQAKVTGFPKPEVKWMKDGRQIYPTDIIDTGVTGDGFQYLEFKTVTMEDVGQYTIFASNEEGTAEAHASLTVVPPPSKPEFLQSLKASKVILGYPVRMEVKLGGHPMPEVQWLKDGQPLNIDGTHYKQIVEPDGTVILQIDAATEGDMGEITCVAKNPEGDSQSSATLSVLGFKREDGQPDGPATFTEGLKDMCFDEGMVMRLPVAMKGGPVPNMKWYKDGQEIKLDDRCFFTYDGDRTYLEIRPCKGSDSGMYKCVIQNSHGSAETECEVSIRKCYEPPFFTSTFTRMDKLPGSEVKMSVRYDGVPKPELSWFHNGEPILHDGDKYRIRKEGDGQTLTVKELTYSDSGNWKVVAKNREGETEHEAELNVSDDVDPNRRVEAPVFMKVIGDQELFEGYNALFKAVVSGKPEPEFKWLKNGGTIVASNRVIMERDPEGLIRLTIKRITPEDAGQYTLKVWNDYGEATCHGKLICETLTSRKKRPVGDEYKGFDRIRRSGVPMPLPEKPMISALADRRLTLSWMPHLAAPQTMPCTYQVEMCDAPDGDWFTVRTGIRGCSVDITNLMPKGDYKFRVRVANKYGVSEPSPYVATQRFKLELPPVRYEPQMDPNYEYKGDGPYVPEGFRISRDSQGNYFAAPRFLRLPHDTQYGLKGFNANIKWYAYGYPTPKVRFVKNGQPLEVGDKTRFKYSQEVTGEICLYIDRMTEADVGTYECLVRNEHGESRQRIKMDICEYPRVLEPLEELHLKANSSGKIACRITGFPPCQVQWFRDWEPIAFTYKLRPAQSEPDLYFLHISGCQIKDSGLYSVAASNVAGTVHSSCMVHVEDDDIGFFWMGPGSGRSVTMNNRRGTLEDHYDVGDELGRGTQGVVYHCVEHHTGRNFAAKSMWGKDQFKAWMQNEFEMMNALNSCKQIVRLYDAYEGPKNMVLVTELCGGGDLLGTLTQHQYLTEYEVCHYVRQILCALEYMHDRCIAHLGLNVGDILLTRPNGIEIKIGDLSLARNIRISKVAPLDYGMPEFVAPEVANGEGVTYAADMWSLGIITYLLLSGTSPFRAENDRETLTRVKKGEMSFDMEAFRHISDEAKDFIAKLLLFKPDVRMNVKDALLHPWIKKCLNPPADAYKINTDRLRSYYAKFRDWYSNASCKRWFRRRTLASCFTHPSKMVYPPGEVYTPPESPERDIVPAEVEDYHVPQRKYSYELGLIKNESHYQMGPDTYLLQLRDVDFPCRLRSYMKVATDRSPAFAMSMRENDYDYTRIPIVHERRRFTDVMDEEIDDERKRTALDRYTAGFVRSRMETCSLDMPRRVKQEVTSRLSIYDEVVARKEGAHYGTAPFLREKPDTCAITDGCPLTLTCVFTGDPEPVVQWFKNDIILGENSRVSIHTANGRSTLTYQECHDYDVGLYKVVARNTLGQATHRFRLVQGHIPGPCDSPDVSEKSDTEVLLHWTPPADDGGSQILCYHVQMKLPGDTEWLTVSENIDHEFFLVKGLTENSIYQFRVAAKNFVGWGDFSVGTAAIRTAAAGAPKVRTTREMQILQQATESGKIVLPFLEKKELDYRKETDPVKLKSGENAQLQVRKYDMIAELSRGRFSVTAKCIRADDRRHFAAKLLENYDREDVVREEFEVFKTLRHERIAQLYEAYNVGDVTVFIMEQLAGLDVLTYLASKREYSEQHVVTIAMQVLDALSYLHWRGMCHLDLQPDNVVLTTPRRCDVKLVDFGSTQRVSKQGSTVPVNGLLDFVAPEVLAEQKAFPSSDIWSLGALIYLLLSGKSAFGGVDEEDTHQNILHVRYRYEHLGSNTTQEAIRFLMLIFKRDPSKRPTLDDCREHKWLVENDYIVKKRERATFLGSQLRDFDLSYHKERAIAATKSLHLLTYGGKEIPAAITYEPETQ